MATLQSLQIACRERAIPYTTNDDMEGLQILIHKRGEEWEKKVPANVREALTWLWRDQSQNTQVVRNYIEKLLFDPD